MKAISALRRKRARILLVAACLPIAILSSPSASEASPAWTWHGPMGGPGITSLAADPVHPGTVVAGTPQGLYRTDDGGDHWSQLDSTGSVRTLFFDPSAADILYADGPTGLRRSGDRGRSWTDLAPIPKSGGYFRQYTEAPSAGGTLYVNADGTGDRGLFKTTDSGDTWTDVTPPMEDGPDSLASHLAVDPNDADAVYLALETTLYVTSDGGATWITRSTDLPFTYGPEVLAVDPLSPNILYAGGFASDGTVVYRSEDAGETWSPASPAGGTWVRSFSFTTDGSLIARGEGGGLWLTTDHAEKWTSLSDRLPGSNVTAVAAGPDGTLTAALSPFGLFSSTDDGSSWSAMADPFQVVLGITTVAVDPTNPRIAFASAGGAGLFKTVDAGEAWHLLYGAGGSDSVAVAPSDARRVYSIPTSLYEHGLLISSDGGATWTPSASSVHPDHLVVDPANADVAYGSSVQD
ncbi:MAG: WD40/YVTN/BNR-like repeat-containing protein, partial [Actinomycetota bacterium]